MGHEIHIRNLKQNKDGFNTERRNNSEQIQESKKTVYIYHKNKYRGHELGNW